MKTATIMGALLVGVTSAATTGAEAHCYSQWHYPWAQRCGVYTRGHQRPAPVLRFAAYVAPPVRGNDILIPDMSATWALPLDSPALLDLTQSLPRLRAIRQLTQGE